MTFFNYKADILPVTLITLLWFADIAVFFLVDNVWLVLFWVLLGIPPKICAAAFNHHHQHCPTFKQVWMNRLLEIVYAFQTGISTNAWVLHHNLGHHVNYLDQTKDESGWQRKDGTKKGCFEYTMQLAATGYTTAYKVGKVYKKYMLPFLQMGVVVALMLTAFMIYNWRNATLIFAIPMLVSYIGTCWHTYFHHAGLDTDDHLHASYNIMHKWYNILTGNLGYHTAHHMKQALHWSELPKYHETIKAGIPSHLFREPARPVYWLPAT